MDTVWIIDHYSSEPQYGGYTRQYNFAQGLANKGYNVVVFASSYSHFQHEYFCENDIQINQVNSQVKYVYLRTKRYSDNSGIKRFFGMMSFVKRVDKVLKDVDNHFGIPKWIVGSSPHPFTWMMAYRYAKKYKAQFIAEVRDFWPLELRGDNDGIIYRVFFAFLECLETWAFRKADLIISTLPYGHRYIKDVKKIDEKKCIYIGQPLDCKRFDTLKIENEKKLPGDLKKFIDNSFYCVFAGYYVEYEGVYKMLEAARIIKEKKLPIKFVFVGSGQEYSGMMEYIQKNQLDNVFLGERISKDCIPALISKSAVCMAYLNDSKNPEMFKYGMSKNKINEYLYSGAITVMGFGYEDNEINESQAGYTFVPTENRFAEYIEKVYNMPLEERINKGEMGREFIKTTHDISSLTQKYIDLVLDN